MGPCREAEKPTSTAAEPCNAVLQGARLAPSNCQIGTSAKIVQILSLRGLLTINLARSGATVLTILAGLGATIFTIRQLPSFMYI